MSPNRDIAGMVQALCNLHDDVGQFLNGYDHRPSPNSLADKELRTFPRAESVTTVYSQGDLLIEVAADQMMAFTKTVTEPAQAIAPWTSVRAVIESCALASWLLDPAIDAKTRVKRSFAFRYEGLSQQVKFGRALGDETNTAKVIARIDNVERVALGLGFPKIQDNKGRRIGIGQPMPNITEIISHTLNEEAIYRTLSAMAHAHPWALQQLSFRRVNAEAIQFVENASNDVVVHAFEKNLEPDSVAFLCYEVMVNFAKPIWYKCQLFGWNQDELGSILDKAFNSIGIREDRRFWKISGSEMSG